MKQEVAITSETRTGAPYGRAGLLLSRTSRCDTGALPCATRQLQRSAGQCRPLAARSGAGIAQPPCRRCPLPPGAMLCCAACACCVVQWARWTASSAPWTTSAPGWSWTRTGRHATCSASSAYPHLAHLSDSRHRRISSPAAPACCSPSLCCSGPLRPALLACQPHSALCVGSGPSHPLFARMLCLAGTSCPTCAANTSRRGRKSCGWAGRRRSGRRWVSCSSLPACFRVPSGALLQAAPYCLLGSIFRKLLRAWGA